jgi:hypothetical protein
MNKWDPHVLVDLHTTNGSYHANHLTYSPILNPNADARLIEFTRTKMLAPIRDAMLKTHNWRTYYYGNFAPEDGGGRESSRVDPANPGNVTWRTFDHRPRFGNNYAGLRNRIAILSEAYSYLTRARGRDRGFVDEIWKSAAERDRSHQLSPPMPAYGAAPRSPGAGARLRDARSKGVFVGDVPRCRTCAQAEMLARPRRPCRCHEGLWRVRGHAVGRLPKGWKTRAIRAWGRLSAPALHPKVEEITTRRRSRWNVHDRRLHEGRTRLPGHASASRGFERRNCRCHPAPVQPADQPARPRSTCSSPKVTMGW